MLGLQQSLIGIILLLLASRLHGLALERNRLFGIWKLQMDPSSALGTNDRSTILLKIQEDGTFQQCNDDDEHEENWLHGCWDCSDDADSELKLALDRRCTPRDILLQGNVIVADNIDSSSAMTVDEGTVLEGKFMYPPGHAAFFQDQTMAASEQVGKFSLSQVMGFYQMMMPATSDKSLEETKQKFQKSDFFNKKFFMTVVPIESKVKPAKVWDSQKMEWFDPTADQAVDIRTMPIQFFANSTFEATGVNKILRGRFEVGKDNKLMFSVSRFGMGRSMAGSVFSEGVGLSHEDERTYSGAIIEVINQQSAKSFRVEGKVTFGADLGSDARPEPVGTFLMTEVEHLEVTMTEEEDDITSDEDLFNSVFE